jgi:chromate transporter
MLAAAAGVGMASDGGWITGLKLVAVAVVAEALRSLGAKLAVGPARASLAAGSAVLVLLVPGVWSQLAAILLGAACGWLLLRAPETTRPPATRQTSGWPWLAALGALLLLLPWAAHSFPGSLAAFAAPYFQAGALVFGGGHVVLPLLEAVTVSQGHLGTEPFLAGYGLAQAVPGPLFTFTAYLGSLSNAGPGGVAGGFLALTATFLPSWLLVLGVHAYWEQVRSRPGAQAALAGANAAVVGLLLAALYDPVGTAVWGDVRFFAFTLVAFTLLRWARMPSWLLVGVGAGAGWMLF